MQAVRLAANRSLAPVLPVGLVLFLYRLNAVQAMVLEQ